MTGSGTYQCAEARFVVRLANFGHPISHQLAISFSWFRLRCLPPGLWYETRQITTKVWDPPVFPMCAEQLPVFSRSMLLYKSRKPMGMDFQGLPVRLVWNMKTESESEGLCPVHLHVGDVIKRIKQSMICQHAGRDHKHVLYGMAPWAAFHKKTASRRSVSIIIFLRSQ